MLKTKDMAVRIIFSLVVIVGLFYIPTPVFSQQDENIQNLITNGKFDEGFQGFGAGNGWGIFSNGQAVVGWNVDTWEKVLPDGQQQVQMIEIQGAQERDRFAGIYQTVPVVAGQQYKLTIKGLIRSDEGDVIVSDYGYRLQYGVDHTGDTTWELVTDKNWQEIPWNEQPLYDPLDGTYRFDTFEATVTAQSDQLTLFIRGWKKWVDNGSGIFNIQEVSLVGPAPEGFEVAMAQVESVESATQQSADQFVGPDTSVPSEGTTLEQPQSQAEAPPEADLSNNQPAADAEVPLASQPQAGSQLPVSGQGQDHSNYVLIISVSLLFVLFAGAVAATMRRRKLTE